MIVPLEGGGGKVAWTFLGGFRLPQNYKHPVDLSGRPGVYNRKMERDTRFELATSTLARLHSTTELVPLVASVFSGELWESQIEILKKNRGRDRTHFISLSHPLFVQ